VFNPRITLSISSLAGYELIDAVRMTKKLGFSSIMGLAGGRAHHSLGTFPTFMCYGRSVEKGDLVKDIIQGFKYVAVHQGWDDNWKEWIDCASRLGAKIVTVHAGLHEFTCKKFQERVLYFRRLGDYALDKGVRIGIENDGERYDAYVKLIKSVKHLAVGATLDLGHCAYFSEIKKISDIELRSRKLNQLIVQIITEVRDELIHMHVHNVKPYEEVNLKAIPYPYWEKRDFIDHRSVPNGIINYERVFDVLGKIGYKGLLVIELEEPKIEEKILESATFLEEFL